MFCFLKPDNVRDAPVVANKLNIKTDAKYDLGPSHCYHASRRRSLCIRI